MAQTTQQLDGVKKETFELTERLGQRSDNRIQALERADRWFREYCKSESKIIKLNRGYRPTAGALTSAQNQITALEQDLTASTISLKAPEEAAVLEHQRTSAAIDLLTADKETLQNANLDLEEQLRSSSEYVAQVKREKDEMWEEKEKETLRLMTQVKHLTEQLERARSTTNAHEDEPSSTDDGDRAEASQGFPSSSSNPDTPWTGDRMLPTYKDAHPAYRRNAPKKATRVKTCRDNLNCASSDCRFAHHGPNVEPLKPMTDGYWCKHREVCQWYDCLRYHPSPASKHGRRYMGKQ